MVTLTDNYFEEDGCIVAERIKAISQEISNKPEFEEALGFLGPAAHRRRDYVQGQITRTIDQFRNDANVDQITMPSRRKRRDSLDRLARAAHILGQIRNELCEPDRLRLSITTGRVFDEMSYAMDEAGVDLVDFLRCLEEAATAAAADMPGEAGGAPKGAHFADLSCFDFFLVTLS